MFDPSIILALLAMPAVIAKKLIDKISNIFKEVKQLIEVNISSSQELLTLSILSSVNNKLALSLRMIDEVDLGEEDKARELALYEELHKSHTETIPFDQMPPLFQKYFVGLGNLLQSVEDKYPSLSITTTFQILEQIKQGYGIYLNSYTQTYFNKIGKKKEPIPYMGNVMGIA